MTYITVPRGLDGVIVDETTISTTDNEGNLLYRGYKTIELAEKVSFEKAAYLVVYGKMPTDSELLTFSTFLKEKGTLSENAQKLIKLFATTANLMDILRTVISFVDTTELEYDRILLELSAKFPKIVSDGYRWLMHYRPLKFPDLESFAARFYYLATGTEDKVSARYLEKLLILYMEHEFNASAFALRVTASTLADPKAAFTTALATLKGPLHGGANAEILDYLLALKTIEDAKSYVNAKLAKKEKIMGFGHRVYKKIDPRAQFVKNELKTLAKSRHSKLYEIAAAVEEEVWNQKHIPANLDFYAAVYMHLLGIDQKLYTPVFAVARAFGWTAHYLEQISNNKLIRPQSRYTGPTDLTI